MDQWGVGRKGFDDGLVILFDLDDEPAPRPGPALRRPRLPPAFLSNEERQAIFENDMLPLLRGGDLDGALLVALAKVDAAATPEHARRRSSAAGRSTRSSGSSSRRSLFLLLVGWAFFHWLRFGRDPVYLDDPSILMPAPPADLTAGERRAHLRRPVVATRADDGAARPRQPGLSSRSARTDGPPHDKKVVDPDAGVAAGDRRWRRPAAGSNARKPLELGRDVRAPAAARPRPSGADAPRGRGPAKFGAKVDELRHASSRPTSSTSGWFTEPPSKVVRRWAGGAAIEIVSAAIALFVGLPTAVLRAPGPRRRRSRGRRS